MILIGYQGISKSILLNNYSNYVDMDRECFWLTEAAQRIAHNNWYESYCNIAEYLSRKGYVVFVSAHRLVRNQLKKSKERVICCVPD